MARRLLCKLSHERGQKFSVGGKLYTIGDDGFVEVDDEHAPLLLQNVGKWGDPVADRTPFKRPSAPPQPILEEVGTGRELSPEETAKVVEKVVGEEPKPNTSDLTPSAPEEKAPESWPDVSTDTSKRELIAVLGKLQAAGHVEAGAFTDKMSKVDLLEVIERAYGAMD